MQSTTSQVDLAGVLSPKNDRREFSSNDFSPAREESSLASVYARLQASGDSLRFFWHWTPQVLRQVAQQAQVTAILGHETGPWRVVRVFLRKDGFFATLVSFTVAVLVNHIRQMLMPRFGTFVQPEPMEHLRLAWTNPAVFLKHELWVPWSVLLASALMKVAADVSYRLASAATTRLMHHDGAPMRESRTDARVLRDQWRRRAWRTCQVVWLALNLLQLEYIFARWVHAASCLLAYGSLARGGNAGRGALRRLVFGADGPGLPRLFVHAGQLLWFVRHGVLPVLEAALVAAIRRRRPGALVVLLAAAYATAAPVRYRGAFFLARELSGLLVFLGLWVASLATLAMLTIEMGRGSPGRGPML